MSHPTTFTSMFKSTRTDIPMRSTSVLMVVIQVAGGVFPWNVVSDYIVSVHITLITGSFYLVLNWESERTKGKKKKKNTRDFVIDAVISD